jgi:hypothetical protein
LLSGKDRRTAPATGEQAPPSALALSDAERTFDEATHWSERHPGAPMELGYRINSVQRLLEAAETYQASGRAADARRLREAAFKLDESVPEAYRSAAYRERLEKAKTAEQKH